MRCPYCGHDHSQVKDSRPTDDGNAIRRRRQCEACGARFTSFERVQLREVMVIKADGRREPFDRDKLLRAATIACRKRPVTAVRIEQLVSGIQRQLETSGDSEASAARIGELVMDALKVADHVAYIRFASVYRDFTDAGDFQQFAASMSAPEPSASASTSDSDSAA